MKKKPKKGDKTKEILTRYANQETEADKIISEATNKGLESAEEEDDRKMGRGKHKKKK